MYSSQIFLDSPPTTQSNTMGLTSEDCDNVKHYSAYLFPLTRWVYKKYKNDDGLTKIQKFWLFCSVCFDLFIWFLWCIFAIIMLPILGFVIIVIILIIAIIIIIIVIVIIIIFLIFFLLVFAFMILNAVTLGTPTVMILIVIYCCVFCCMGCVGGGALCKKDKW